MRIETIATGDELLTGLIADTNSAFFQTLLLERTGLTVRRGVVVGDERDDIIEALDAAASRCDVVLVSGGLGPTMDDFTAECAAKAAGVTLVESEEAWQHLVARFAVRGLQVTPNNRRQAQVPQGAEVVLNLEGAAPMFVQQRGRCTLYFVPGVPAEYRHLVETHVVPRIAARVQRATVRRLTVLKTVLLPESHLDERVRPLVAKHPRVTFGFRTHAPENHLKLLAEADTPEAAELALDAAAADARALLGAYVFGEGDETLAGAALRALTARGEYVALAESCTGGLVASLLTAEAGASKALYGGVVTYLEEAKSKWAHVPPGMMAQFSAVSPEVTDAMARGVRGETGATWGLAVTGYAGPAGENVGQVFVSLAGPNGATTKSHVFHGNRERIRTFAAAAALDLLRRTLTGAAS